MPDYDTPLDKTLRAMGDLVREGKVRYLGCSNFRAFQVGKALWLSVTHKLARWDIVQPPFNLLARDIEYELLPLCLEKGVGVAVFSPLAAGFLSGKYEAGKPAEVYPSLWSRAFAREGRTGDQQDACVVAAWLRQADLDGNLAEFLHPSLTADERKRAEIEGRILGIK
jgi:aryl-alcohol dehydrogenase-like predicted oxidoreductase